MHQSPDLKSMTDNQLMQRFVKLQNEQSYAELYEKYFTEVCRYVSWLMGDRDSAQDLVQNVFLKIYQKPELFNPEKEFKVWLFTVAKNAWRNELRANGIRKQNQEQFHFESDGKTNVDHSARLVEVEVALKSLSEDHREVFILKYSNNLSLQEISEVCDCNLGTVKSRLFYALKHMRELVKTKKQNVS
jgi:RNA polymerase sigma-70 factor (ECF subfamily)